MAHKALMLRKAEELQALVTKRGYLLPRRVVE